jgi:hypothetical protein
MATTGDRAGLLLAPGGGLGEANHLRTELPLQAPEMALTRRTPTDTLIHHTDRGCQDTSVGVEACCGRPSASPGCAYGCTTRV